ncbi:MAG: ferrochelatase [Chloroflexi bacterium]|nr:ferrochelatase [Chloroflexota bacterium]
MNRSDDTHTAVLLMAYGSPDSLEDIEAYLHQVRGGRHTPPELVEEVRERYRRIGGRSPLQEITEQTAHRLQEATGLPVFIGMHHWHPFIRDVVQHMVTERGIRRIVGICLAPHYSTVSVGAYRRHLEEAIAAVGGDVDLRFVPHWHTHRHYLDGLVETTRQTLDSLGTHGREYAVVIFTAHSVPAAVLNRGDPYDAQLRETAQLLAERLALPEERWRLCYQSAPKTHNSWLGPQMEDVIVELAEAGRRYLVVAPIGFVSEHVEILYDIDIKAQEIARSHGALLKRTPMLNSRPPLIAALSDLVQKALNHPND